MVPPPFTPAEQAILDTIPAWEIRPQTWLDIAGIGSREVSICQILRYFLDPQENHGLGQIWLDALMSLLPKSPHIPSVFDAPSGVEVLTEVPTAKGRIDVLITSDISAIAIEAKVWHWIANPLDDYERYCQKQVGSNYSLVLLAPYRANKSGWTSITYEELAAEVERNLGAELLQMTLPQIAFLQQFLQHMKSIVMDEATKKAYEHFFRHHKAVARAAKLSDSVNDWIFSEVKQFAESIGWKRDGVQEGWWCELYNSNRSVCIEFVKQVGLIESPYFSLKLWLKKQTDFSDQSAAADLWKQTEQFHKNLSIREEPQFGHVTDYEDWFVFGYCKYNQLTVENWLDFPQTLKSRFDQDFAPLIQAVASHLKVPGLSHQ